MWGAIGIFRGIFGVIPRLTLLLMTSALLARRARTGTRLLLLLLLLAAWPARATHIVGGELDLQYVRGSTYQLTLTLYFDAINGNPGALDQTLTASIFAQGTDQRLQDVVLPLTGNTFVAYTNPACTSPSLSTRQLIYSRSVELPAAVYASPQGYYVAVERCCRNNSISNIQLPADAAQTFYLEFPAVVRNGRPFLDSTPKIFPPLSDYACQGDLFTYDFGGQDPDKDSLVYALATPLNGHSSRNNSKPLAAPAPYDPVDWNPGLGEQNQIPGAPTLTIDRATGRLQVRPTQVGLFVFAIRCAEYRRGQKIGEVRRDFQLKVLDCPRNAPPRILAQLPSQPRTYVPGRDTLRLTPTGNRCVRLRFTDPDPTSALTLQLVRAGYLGPLPTVSLDHGTVHANGMPDTLVSELCFPACVDTQGKVQYLSVVVADNGCALPKRDTVRLALLAQPVPNVPPTLTSTATLPLRARPGDVVSFEVTATDGDGDPVTLSLAGRNFSAPGVGAQLLAGPVGTPTTGRFSWRVDCAAVGQPVYEFEFTATAAPCQQPQTTKLVVPVRVDYQNQPPVLTSTLPPAAAAGAPPRVVRLGVGQVYEADLTATDADNDALTLTATGAGFELAAANMRFGATNGRGRASGKFRWEAVCAAAQLPVPLEVTFQVLEATCRPQPQAQVVRFEVVNPDTLTFLPPNIITPNRDGKNDVFTLPTLPPDYCDARFADIKIFSRWGNQVYASTDRAFRWDGDGRATGVYFYLIEYTDGRRFKGLLTVAP